MNYGFYFSEIDWSQFIGLLVMEIEKKFKGHGSVAMKDPAESLAELIVMGFPYDEYTNKERKQKVLYSELVYMESLFGSTLDKEKKKDEIVKDLQTVNEEDFQNVINDMRESPGVFQIAAAGLPMSVYYFYRSGERFINELFAGLNDEFLDRKPRAQDYMNKAVYTTIVSIIELYAKQKKSKTDELFEEVRKQIGRIYTAFQYVRLAILGYPMPLTEEEKKKEQEEEEEAFSFSKISSKNEDDDSSELSPFDS